MIDRARSCAVLIAGAVLAIAGGARAQLARAGETVVVSDVAATKRLPAVAYDAEHERWLVVWSLFPVGARFLAADGTPLGAPFVVPERNPGGSLAPRVAYAPAIDAFLVAWIEEEGSATRIVARLLREGADGAPAFLGSEVIVSENGRPKHPESSPSVSWSERSRTFLVTWSDVEGDLDVRARRLDESAAPIGEELQLSSGEAFDAFPVVALGEASDAWLVAWTYEPVTGGGSIATRTVGAADGALGAETVLYASTYENYPDVAYDARRDRFLVVSWHIEPGRHDVYGRFAGADGAPIGDVIPIAASAEFEGGDGIGLAYSRDADAYVSVFQSTTTEIWASLVSGDGAPSAPLEATRGARMGTYAPRIAAQDGAPRWLLVTSADFDRIVVQGLEAPGAPMPDAGVLEDAGTTRDAGHPIDAGSRVDAHVEADAGGRTSIASGCACRAAPVRGSRAFLAAMLVTSVLARRRSRRASYGAGARSKPFAVSRSGTPRGDARRPPPE